MSRTGSRLPIALVAVVALLCLGGLLGLGLVVKNAVTIRPCVPPYDEASLLAAYTAEPLLTADQPAAASTQPVISYFCHLTGTEHLRPTGYTAVQYRYVVSGWQTADALRAAYGSAAAAEGWTFANSRDDEQIAGVEFCRPVGRVASTLVIALKRDAGIGGPIVAARSIASIPANTSCPFHVVWGPFYRP
jgi:hypothetical protein